MLNVGHIVERTVSDISLNKFVNTSPLILSKKYPTGLSSTYLNYQHIGDDRLR